jgi:hypothetical protein
LWKTAKAVNLNFPKAQLNEKRGIMLLLGRLVFSEIRILVHILGRKTKLVNSLVGVRHFMYDFARIK